MSVNAMKWATSSSAPRTATRSTGATLGSRWPASVVGGGWVRGTTTLTRAPAATVSAPTRPKATRHPAASPSAVNAGIAATVPTVGPALTTATALAAYSPRTKEPAVTTTNAQKSPCPAAARTRAATRIQKVGATAVKTVAVPVTTSEAISTARRSSRLVTRVSGRLSAAIVSPQALTR